MADNADLTMHFNIATPRLGEEQPSSGRPRAVATLAGAGGDPMHSDVHIPVIGMNGAGGDPVHGDMHTIGGRAGGDPVQSRRALGLPESFNPGRERSHTPRRDGTVATLRSGSSPPERLSAMSIPRRQTPESGYFWMQCTDMP